MRTLFFALFLICFILAEKTRYDNYSLVRVKVNSHETLQLLMEEFKTNPIDIWSNDGRIGINIDIDMLLSQEQMQKLMNFLLYKNGDLELRVLHNNIQNLIDEEEKAMYEARMREAKLLSSLTSEEEKIKAKFSYNNYFDNYPTLEEMKAFIENLHKQYPEMTELFSIGKTHEGRDIFGIKIYSPGKYDPSKPAIHFNSLIHAREWISGMVTQYAAMKLLEGYKTNSTITRILDELNFHIIPALNADGYKFSETSRLWRKNRNKNSGSCQGVDLNRNFKIGYGIGSSTNECSETFRGKSPLSEPETQAIDAYFKSHKNIAAGIDFHSYSQLVMRPWGHKHEDHKREAEQRALGQKMVDAIRATHRESYSNIKSVSLYPAGGGLDDHMAGEIDIVSYCIELRDKGRYGFVLPPTLIKPTVEENFNAIIVFAQHFLK